MVEEAKKLYGKLKAEPIAMFILILLGVFFTKLSGVMILLVAFIGAVLTYFIRTKLIGRKIETSKNLVSSKKVLQKKSEKVTNQKSNPQNMSMTKIRMIQARALIILIITLAVVYFILSPVFDYHLGIHLPQPFANENPREVILSNPSYEENYNLNVDIKTLQKLLNNHPYNRTYEENVFDCSDMSKELARYLQEEEEYDTSVIGDDLDGHAWVYVWTGENMAWAIETTEEGALARGSSGEIIGDEWWDSFWANRNLMKQISGGVSVEELHYPSYEREGVHVLEWYEVIGR